MQSLAPSRSLRPHSKSSAKYRIQTWTLDSLKKLAAADPGPDFLGPGAQSIQVLVRCFHAIARKRRKLAFRATERNTFGRRKGLGAQVTINSSKTASLGTREWPLGISNCTDDQGPPAHCFDSNGNLDQPQDWAFCCRRSRTGGAPSTTAHQYCRLVLAWENLQ